MKKILIILILLIPLNIYAEEINLLTDKYIVYDETSDKVRLSSNENEKVFYRQYHSDCGLCGYLPAVDRACD